MTVSTLTFGSWTGTLGMGLAERELQCVLAVAAGLTSKEAAREFGVAKDSVDKRILAASTKLGVIRRAQLVGEAIKRGVISPAAALALLLAVHGALATDPMAKVRRSGGSESKIETRIASKRHEIALAA